MKNRDGFVSNSSSSSFVINKYYISGYIMDKIREHEKVAKNNAWAISDRGDVVTLSTNMDNFDMEDYLRQIGLPEVAFQEMAW